MTKEELKQYIDDNIYENVDGDISGDSLNEVLKAIVDDGGTEVEANPEGTPTAIMNTIKIGETIYTAPQGPVGPPGADGQDGQDGQDGAPGPANTLSIGTVTDGEQAAASITGDAPNQTLNLTLPAGKSAYQLYVDGGGTLTQEQWLASLKANIGAFQFITPTDTTAEAALTTIGSTYSNAIGGVPPTPETLEGIILLMNDSNNTKTMMIATQYTQNGGFEFVYAGNLQDAMPSNVLTQTNIVNDLTTGGSINVLSAEQGKEIGSTLYGEYGFADISPTITNESYYAYSSNKINVNKTDYGFSVSTRISVTPGEKFKIFGKDTPDASTVRLWCFSDGTAVDGKYSAISVADNNTDARENGVVITAPEGSAYLSIAFYRYDSTKDKIQKWSKVEDGLVDKVMFESGEKVNETYIDDTHLVNPKSSALPTANDVLPLKAKLEGIDAHEEKLTTFTTTSGLYMENGSISTYIEPTALCTEVEMPQNCKTIRFLGLAIRSELNENNSNVAYLLGHYNNSNWVTDYVKRFDKNTENITITKEYVVKVPLGSTHFRTEVKYSSMDILTLSNFYCYFEIGDTVKDFVDGQTNEIHSELGIISHSPNVTANKRLVRENNITKEIVTAGWCVSDFVKIPDGTTNITWYNGKSGYVNNLYSLICIYADKNEESFIDYYSNNASPRTIDLTNKPTAKYVRASFIMGYDDAKLVGVFGNVFFKVDLSNGDLQIAENKIESLQSYDAWKEYPLTSEIQQGTRNTGNWAPSSSTTAVRTECITLVPYDGARYKILMPDDYAMRFHYGNIISQQNQGSSTVIGTFFNGDEFDVPVHNANLSMVFYHTGLDTTTIPSTVAQLIADGKIKLLYKTDNSVSVQAKNQGSDRFAKTAIYKFNNTALNSYVGNIPAIGHFSDLHGDIVRLRNMMEYLQWLGVDVIVNTGDTAANKASNGMSFYHNEVKNYGIPTLITVGNHDVWYDDTSLSGHTQNELSYEDVIEPNSILFGYNLPTSEYYDDAPTYYYKDLTDKKLRIIVLNQYEQGLRSWDTFGRISQKQIDWFINTLATTPAEYGVIVASHWVNDNLVKNSVTEPFCKLIGNQGIFTNDNYANNVVVGRPIVKIIDAFISRTSGSDSYTQTIKNDVVETINYTYDFSSVDNTVEFICHLNGHTHIDAVGYYKHATNPQLCINISTAQSIYGFVHPYKANDSDCVRGGKGATEDLFNVYGIDRDAHTVRIARVGADFSDDGRFRQFIIVPYNSISQQ